MHKGVVASAITGCLLSGLMIVATPAAASTSCFTKSKHYALSDGSISLRVAYTDFSVQVCTNGSEITSTRADTSSDTTGPGDGAGFDVSFHNPVTTTFNSGGPVSAGLAGYTAKGRLRDCIPYLTVWCSDSEDFAESVRVEMYAYPDRIPYALPAGSGWFAFKGRWFRVSWGAKCTNSVCGVKFH